MSEASVPQNEPPAQDAIRTSASVAAIIPAFVKAQSEFPAVKKDQTGKVEGQGKRGNDYSYEYSYADLAGILATIQPILTKHGLGVMQPIVWNGSPWLLTRLLHESGEWMEARYKLGEHDRPQEMGSEITYARRYNLTAFLGITTEGDDDDGKKAGENGGGRRTGSGKSSMPNCPICKDDEGRPTNKGVIVSKHGPGYYCHGHRAAFQIEEPETRTAPAEAKAEPKAATPARTGAARVPGADGEEPPRASIPEPGSPAWEDAAALGSECMRLTGGSVKDAGTLLAQIAGGLRTARGMKGNAVRGAWLMLADHPTYGIAK